MDTLSRLLEFDQTQKPSADFLLAGVDEVGRGPLAGPVVAAAVIMTGRGKLEGLNDSKKVSPPQRKILFWEIIRSSRIGIGAADEGEIDRINILQASRLAMKRAVLALNQTPDSLLIDGTFPLELPLPQKTVIGGDAKSACIAAASIVAKVFRDSWMQHLDGIYPAYGFADHKGYPTPFHLEALERLGPTPVHRRSFSPVSEVWA